MKLAIFITAQTEKSMEVATVWQEAGATGVTILEGHGLHRLQEKIGMRDDIPLIPSISALMRGQETATHVLISVMDNALATRLIELTTEVVGDLNLPGTGVVFTIDVSNVSGLRAD